MDQPEFKLHFRALAKNWTSLVIWQERTATDQAWMCCLEINHRLQPQPPLDFMQASPARSTQRTVMNIHVNVQDPMVVLLPLG
jgi:hypothetical protein